MSAFICSPVSCEQRESVLGHEAQVSRHESSFLWLSFCSFLFVVGVFAALFFFPTLGKINAEPDAVSHVFPALDFGTASGPGCSLQELILMHR